MVLCLIKFHRILSGKCQLLIEITEIGRNFSLIIQRHKEILAQLPFQRSQAIRKGFDFPLIISAIIRIPANPMILNILCKSILHLNEFFCERRKECPDYDASDSIPLFRFLPQTMVDRKQVADIHLFPILHKGRSAKQTDDIFPSAVAHINVSAIGSLIHIHGSQRFADGGNRIKHLLLHANLTDFLRPFSILLSSNL